MLDMGRSNASADSGFFAIDSFDHAEILEKFMKDIIPQVRFKST
jgi:hypothetical protein